MTTFDSPDREFCTVRRARTNTPLQALTLWNEPGYLEAARQLGTRMVREGGTDDPARVAFAFRLATGRRPKPTETAVLTKTLAQLRSEFTANGSDAYAFVKIGASPIDATPCGRPCRWSSAVTFAAALGVSRTNRSSPTRNTGAASVFCVVLLASTVAVYGNGGRMAIPR